MRVQEAFDELKRATVVPMQFVAPVPRFFFKKRLNLTDRSLSQIDDVHELRKAARPLQRHSIIKEVKEREKAEEVKKETQRNGAAQGAMQKMCYDANHQKSIVR